MTNRHNMIMVSTLLKVESNRSEIDIDTATKNLVSTINGFKDLTADDAEGITDVLNNLGNKFAVSSADLGEILQRSSAALSEANNNLNEAVALGTVAQTINQDASRVGTALKTLSLRIRGATMELEQEGLDTENMAETTADLRKYVLAAAGVDILEKDQKTFKSTYQILLEISKVWEDIGDLERSALLQKLGGKMQANIVSSILNNGELLQKVYEEAENSAGSAMAEQEAWSKSLEASFGRISATFQSISSNLLSSEEFKSFLDVCNNILDVIDNITKAGAGAIPIFASLSGVMGSMGNGIFSIQNMNQSKALINSYNNTLSLSNEEQIKFANTISQTNPRFASYISNLDGAKASLGEYNNYLRATAIETAALSVKTALLNTFINAGIGIIIGLVVTGISKWINAEKELNNEITERVSNTEDSLESLDSYAESIENVANSAENETEKIKQLNDIKDNLSIKYRREIDDINDVADARQNLIDIINQEKLAELNEFYRTSIGDYAKQSKTLLPTTQTVDGETNGGGWNLSQMTAKNVDVNDVRKEVTDLLKDYKVQGDNLGFVIEVGDDVDQYYQNLKKVSEELTRFQSISGEKWTQSEQAIYDSVSSEIDRIENLFYGDNNVYENTIRSAQNYANLLMMIMPKDENQTLAEYKEILYNLIDANSQYGEGAYFVKQAVDDLLNSNNKLNNSLEETDPLISEILANFKKIEETCSDVSTAIGEADEKFEKLTKTIEDNKDTSKFFSASDIIEILDLYPELADSIQECAYGYKIEEEALETLRQTKLEEKKVALQTQLDEAQSLLNSTNAKLALYKNELDGISDVAKAKIKLAELEAQLAGINYNPSFIGATKEAVEYAKVQQEIAKYNEFVELSNTAEQAQQTIDKLGIELAVLGTTFDDAKDATSDATKALNEQKDSLSDLKKEMEDYKGYIEDLIDLTMSYIKKSKELEKEALSEQLSNYKKLIDKKKELIDLEKDYVKTYSPLYNKSI